jgi:methionyl-tRNA formyltransferase
VRIVFLGTPELAIPTLQRLVEAGHEVSLVVTQVSRPAGRGRQETLPPVGVFAQELGLPIFQPDRVRRPEHVERIRAERPDAIVVAAFGQILPANLLEIPPLGCLNLHPSLLPRHRGASPISGAILAGDERTGVSIMLMDEGMDTGPVLRQVEVPIQPADDQVTLSRTLSELGANELVATLEAYARGDVTPVPQVHEQATFTRKTTREDGLLDWQSPAVELWRRVRAFAEWPQAYTTWDGKLVRILRTELDETVTGEPGVVQPWGRPARVPIAAAIGTGQGMLLPQVIGLEGRRPLPVDEYLRGQQRFVGAKLGT